MYITLYYNLRFARNDVLPERHDGL